MSDANATRTFQCSHCSTGIQIPANLPPTTAPCPKCGQEVTSPPLETVVPEPVVEPIIESTVEPAVEPQEESVSILTKKSAKPVADAVVEVEVEEGQPSGKGGKLKFLMLSAGLVALLLLAAAAAKIFLPSEKKDVTTKTRVSPQQKLTPEERRDNAYRRQGWIEEAEAVLVKFLEAKTVEERAALTIRGSLNEAEMAAVYDEFAEEVQRTPVDVFSPMLLADQDTKRGIFLMIYNRPEQFAIGGFFRPVPPMRVKYGLEEPDLFLVSEASLINFVDQPLRVMAYFLKTPEGMKLDWQSYAQTKYRLLRQFVDNPEAGRKGVFRVFVQEDVDLDGRDGEGFSVFRFSDPANQKDFAKVLVKNESELGRALAPLKWRGRVVGRAPIRNATVSLIWSNDEQPVLQMGELICWEFLGLGGERGNWKKGASE